MPLVIQESGPCAGHPCDACQRCLHEHCCRKDNPHYHLPELGDWKQPIFGELGRAAYPDGDRIQCHICGESFRILRRHIEEIHDVLAMEYKAYFGLNRSFGLTALSLKQRNRERGLALWGKYRRAPDPLSPERISDLVKGKRRLQATLNEVQKANGRRARLLVDEDARRTAVAEANRRRKGEHRRQQSS